MPDIQNLSINGFESETDEKPECEHGANCYRKNPKHFQDYSHPSDLQKSSYVSSTPCKFGINCYNQNSDHRSKYSHPTESSADEDEDEVVLPPCPYGAKCYRKNPEHLSQYSHPAKDSADDDTVALPPCRYGAKCHSLNPEHRSKYSHPAGYTGGQEPVHTPHYWNSRLLKDDYQEITLSSGSVEFTVVSRLLNDTIRQHGSGLGTINGKDPTGFIVTNIRRVHNKLLWEEYLFKKKKIMKNNNGSVKDSACSTYTKSHPFLTPLIDENANEYWLFHGCSKQILDIVTHKGYDNRVSSVDGMFGGGFYLAENSSKANQYIPCPQCGNNSFSSKGNCTCSGQENIVYSMLMYRAVLGDIHVVQKYQNKYKTNEKGPVRRAPEKNDKGDVYDSVLGESRQHGGDSLNYREVILYELGQAYPEYIIDFRRSLQPQITPTPGKSVLDECNAFLDRKK